MRHSNGPPAVRAGDFVYLSSVKGVDPETQVSDSDVAKQLRQAMANIDVVLEGAGASKADIVKVTVYLEGFAENRSHLDQVWGEYFEGNPPARATVAVDSVGVESDPSVALFDVVAYRRQDI
jgi:2-iminobutanoate/2-iminopropanoate deaminase